MNAEHQVASETHDESVGENDSALRVLSLYSSCGGLDLGFLRVVGDGVAFSHGLSSSSCAKPAEDTCTAVDDDRDGCVEEKRARFRIVRAIEPDASAAQTYRLNIIDRMRQQGALLQVGEPRDFRFEIDEADIIVGAPPCAETFAQSNICSLSKRASPPVCDLVNTASMSPIHRESNSSDRESTFEKDDDDFANGGKMSTSSSSSSIDKINATVTKKKKPSGAALKKKRKNAALFVDGSPSACSYATSMVDDARDLFAAGLERSLKRARCIVDDWPIDPMPQPKGYRQWWCNAIYYKKKDERRLQAVRDAKRHECSVERGVYDVERDEKDFEKDEYDADTETSSLEEESEGETMVAAAAAAAVRKTIEIAEIRTRRKSLASRRKRRTSATAATKRRRKQQKPPTPLTRFIDLRESRALVAAEPAFDDDPIFDFLNIVGRVSPLCFVLVLPPKIIENNDLEPMLDEIVRTASLYNYAVESVILDAGDFGVPQTKRRAFLIGKKRSTFAYSCSVSANLFFSDAAQRIAPVSCGDVLRQMPRPGEGANTGLCKARVVPTRDTSSGLRCSAYAGQIFNGGGRPIDLRLPCNTFSRFIGGNFTPIVDQAHIDDPSVEPWYETYFRALRDGEESAILALLPVPDSVRRLTVTEAKVLSGFDIDYELCGSYTARFRQVGSACVPQVALRVAQYVLRICGEE